MQHSRRADLRRSSGTCRGAVVCPTTGRCNTSRARFAISTPPRLENKRASRSREWQTMWTGVGGFGAGSTRMCVFNFQRTTGQGSKLGKSQPRRGPFGLLGTHASPGVEPQQSRRGRLRTSGLSITRRESDTTRWSTLSGLRQGIRKEDFDRVALVGAVAASAGSR
jgi:hypothetical protein